MRRQIDFSWLNLDTIVGLATILALIIAGWQLRQNTKLAGQTYAKGAWLRYLELGLRHPEFGSTDMVMKHMELGSVDEILQRESVDTERYLWFVEVMMEACEAIVNYFPEKEWQNTIRYNVRLHIDTIGQTWQDSKKYYSQNLQRIVDETLDERTSMK